jgi:hypothetical protein
MAAVAEVMTDTNALDAAVLQRGLYQAALTPPDGSARGQQALAADQRDLRRAARRAIVIRLVVHENVLDMVPDD